MILYCLWCKVQMPNTIKSPQFTSSLPLVLGRVMDPQDVHVLIPRTRGYVTVHSKRNFADMFKDLEVG